MATLHVLKYLPRSSGAARLVDVKLQAMKRPGPRYEVDILQPSEQVRAWTTGGARFALSPLGMIRVWQGRRLAAAECPREHTMPGVAALSPDDSAYLEAYLVMLGSRWNHDDLGIPGLDPVEAPRPQGRGSCLRILHTEAATSYGGQEYSIYKEMVAMRQRGHHLEAVCQPQAELGVRLRSAGFVVHALPMDGVRDFWGAVGGIRRLLQRTPFDVVNTHSRRDTVLAAIAARVAGTPLIVRTRHLAKPINSLFAYTWLTHRVIAVSDFVRRQLLERGAPPEKIGRVYSPVESPAVDDRTRVRRELGLSPDTPVIGCVAVMREDKGLTDLLDAFRRVGAKYPRAHLVLAGDGEPMLSQLRARAVDLGLADRIHFLGRREDIGNVMTAFDVFALPTRREALGTVFIEAAALGLPVIGGDVDGVSETMLPGVSGILVPPRDAAALSMALDDLLANPERRRAMGAAGRSHVLAMGKFTPGLAAAHVESLYGDWLAERGWPVRD